MESEMLQELIDMGWECQESEIMIFVGNSCDHQTTVTFDFYPGGVVEVYAVLDSGSSVSFLSKSISLELVPHYLDWLLPCPTQFKRVEGRSIPKVWSTLYTICWGSSKMIEHHF